MRSELSLVVDPENIALLETASEVTLGFALQVQHTPVRMAQTNKCIDGFEDINDLLRVAGLEQLLSLLDYLLPQQHVKFVTIGHSDGRSTSIVPDYVRNPVAHKFFRQNNHRDGGYFSARAAST